VKIVSLCPSLTELVFDLRRGSDLVGITRFCVHPAEEVDSVRKVGGTKDPDVEQIIALQPDLVLFNEEENRREDFEALERAGVPCLSTFPKDALETAVIVREIGAAIERGEEAERIAGDIEARVARVREETSGADPIRFAYLIWRKPWMTVNTDTFSHSLLAQAGGVNVFADAETRYPSFELAELARAAPELVLLSTEPYPFKERHAVELAAACHLPLARVPVVDGEYLSWYGSRTPAGVDYAAALLKRVRDGLS
jgi:iron complex transport system substrate-binding protein